MEERKQREPLELRIKKGKLILGDLPLDFVEHFRLVVDSDLLIGTAELELKLLVRFSDNTQEQDPLPIQSQQAET